MDSNTRSWKAAWGLAHIVPCTVYLLVLLLCPGLPLPELLNVLQVRAHSGQAPALGLCLAHRLGGQELHRGGTVQRVMLAAVCLLRERKGRAA